MKAVKRILRLAVIIGIVYAGWKCYSLGYFPSVEPVLNRVARFNSSYVKVQDDEVFLKLNGELVNAEDIKVLGWKMFEPIYIDYDGERITINENGVVSAVKFLSNLGLIEEVG